MIGCVLLRICCCSVLTANIGVPMEEVRGIATDSLGNSFVSDCSDFVVKKISNGGLVYSCFDWARGS